MVSIAISVLFIFICSFGFWIRKNIVAIFAFVVKLTFRVALRHEDQGIHRNSYKIMGASQMHDEERKTPNDCHISRSFYIFVAFVSVYHKTVVPRTHLLISKTCFLYLFVWLVKSYRSLIALI